MFFAIIATFLDSLATIFWKKALSFPVPKELFNLLSKVSLILVATTLYFTNLLDFNGVNTYYILLLIVITIIGTIKTVLNQYIYSIEKISILMPYTNINKILSIVFAFILFGDISYTSFIITLIAIFVIIGFTIDIKTLKVPKIIGLFSFGEIVQSILTLSTGYILLEISGSAFFVISYIIGIVFVGTIVAYKGQFKKLKEIPSKFYLYRFTACHFGGIGYLLGVFIIKELGLSISILLSFLGIGITLFFSYFFLRDKPSKKDLILTTIVSILVGIGYYLK